MAIEAVGATVSLPNNAVVNITPPGAEVWCLTYFAATDPSGNNLIQIRMAVGVAVTGNHPPMQAGYITTTPVNAGAPMLGGGGSRLILNNSKYLSVMASGVGASNAILNYSGVKL